MENFAADQTNVGRLARVTGAGGLGWRPLHKVSRDCCTTFPNISGRGGEHGRQQPGEPGGPGPPLLLPAGHQHGKQAGAALQVRPGDVRLPQLPLTSHAATIKNSYLLVRCFHIPKNSESESEFGNDNLTNKKNCGRHTGPVPHHRQVVFYSLLIH